jgi:hypothetical protein
MRRETSEMAQKDVMDELAPTVGKVADYFTELVSRHSFLVGATTLATSALTAFAGVAVTVAFAMGGRKVLVSGAMNAAGAVASGVKSAAGMVARAATSKSGLAAGSFAGGYWLGGKINDRINAKLSEDGQERSLGTMFADSRFGKWLSGVDIDEEAIAKAFASVKPRNRSRSRWKQRYSFVSIGGCS